MTDRAENILRRRRPPTIVVSQFEPEITRADPNRVVNKRPRIIGSAAQSQRPIQRLPTVQRSRVQRRNLPPTPMNEEAGLIPVEQVDSDSDSNSDPERVGEEENNNITGGAAEAQHQHHNVTPSALAPSQPEQATSGGEAAGEEITLVLTDSRKLNCVACRNPVFPPIFQCDNRHLACFVCQMKLLNKCPSCSISKGFFHIGAMDDLIESMRVDCKNKKNGCKETLMYHQKADHENTCLYTLCLCPIPSCGFEATSHRLYGHFRKHHVATPFTFGAVFNLRMERTQKLVILQERNDGVIFILNHVDIEGHGRVLCLDVIGAGVIKSDFDYQLSVKSGDTCVSMESVPEICAKWKERTLDHNCLKIPSDFEELFIQICIN